MTDFNNIEHRVIFEKLTEVPLYDSLNDAHNIRRDTDEVDNIGRYLSETGSRIQKLNAYQNNPYYRVIVSNRKVIGKLIIFIKRIIRRLLMWLIEPVCAQQTIFNSELTPCIGRLVEIEADSRTNIASIQERVTALEGEDHYESVLESKYAQQAAKLADLEQSFKAMQDKLSCFDTENDTSFWNKQSTSQSGEDMIIAYIAQAFHLAPQECNYLDLGANHPKDMSNTYHFYSKGASGVLVEANPRLINELKFHRNRDVILNKCIAPVSGEQVEFYILSGDGLSTPDYNSAMEAIQKNRNLSIIDTVMIETISVNDIFAQYFSKAPVIMNIDIEGKELEILESIDLKQYRPIIIILEMIPYKPKLVFEDKREDITLFMINHNYIEYAFTGINSIFIDREKIEA
jgi:FkbM family methyltransferase